jgi:octaprenyl-diphosphate synthase
MIERMSMPSPLAADSWVEFNKLVPQTAGLLACSALTVQPSPPKIPRFFKELPDVTLEQLYALIGPDMKAVDAVIRDRLHSDVVLVRQVAEYIIGSGGKRMRPALVLLAAGALGYEGTRHHEMAAVVEFIHTATLLHDDVVDESALRRGNDTANAMFGNAASVLVGDFLYSRAFQMMVMVDNMRVMQVLSDATNIIAEGEVLQLMNCHDADVDEARYMQVIHYKTAKLFEAAAQLGAILGQATPEVEAALAKYGMHLGTAFQLIDDVLDYSGQEADTGKHIGDDLAEGKPTLPLIYVMQHGTAEQAACVRKAIEAGGRDDFPDVLDAIRKSGALEHARARAAHEGDLARASIQCLGDSNFKKALLQLTLFAVERNH